MLLENIDPSRATLAKLDLGGGAVGSLGRNCVYGGQLLDVAAVGYDLSARRVWWGGPGGPPAGRVVAVGATVDSTSALARRPSVC